MFPFDIRSDYAYELSLRADEQFLSRTVTIIKKMKPFYLI